MPLLPTKPDKSRAVHHEILCYINMPRPKKNQMEKDKISGPSPASPRLSLKEKQKQLREETILDAAHRLMAMQGYEATTMDEVAQSVGIAKATLYNEVSSKEDLALAVVVRSMRQSVDYLRHLDETLPAIERLRQILTWVIQGRFGEAGIDFRAADASIVMLVKNNADFRHVEKALIDEIAALIDAAKTEGDINPALSTRILSRVLLSLVQDGSYQEMIQSRLCSIDDLIGTFTAMIANCRP